MGDKILQSFQKQLSVPSSATELGSGAEASIFRSDDVVYKVRSPKSYRHESIDVVLRKQRSRKEAKVLLTLNRLGVPAPTLIAIDEHNCSIQMSFLEGEKLRDVLEDHVAVCKNIGAFIALMHSNNIVHGDLTTSNMIFQEGSIAFIDFGLSFSSTKIEDKAVDLHLFKQALASKHYTIDEEAWELFLEGYQLAERKEILARLAEVELRGRNKHG